MSKKNNRENECFDQYWRYASTLRNWFVGYGIGIAALFVTKSDVLQKMTSANKLNVIIPIFIGVLSQIIVSFLNKISQWCIYSGEYDKKFKKTLSYKCAWNYTSKIEHNIIFDLITLLSLIYGTIALIAGMV